MSKSSLIQQPLNVLKSVQQTMHTQFPHMDIEHMFQYVHHGYQPPGSSSNSNPHPSANIDAAAAAAFETQVGQHVKKFALMLETVAPTLVRFRGVVHGVHQYIAAQKRQAHYLQNILNTTYASVVITLFAFTFKVWELTALTDVAKGLKIVLIIVMSFYVLHALIFTMKIMLDHRLNIVRSIDTGVLDKYDNSLGNNVYVKVAEAFTRGDAKKFITSYAHDVLTNSGSEADDVVYNFCSQASGQNAVSTHECFVSPCPNHNQLADVLHPALKNAWARSKDDVQDCDRMILALLQALADVKSGDIFHENDPYTMWREIQDGVDHLRTFVYRQLDVHAGGAAAAASEHPDAVKVVRDQIVPALKIDAMECGDLKSVDASLKGTDKTALEFHMNPGITSKEQCWSLALRDPKCVWAYFHPGKGGVLATLDCGNRFTDAHVDAPGTYCVKLENGGVYPNLEYSGNEEEHQGVVLVKIDSSSSNASSDNGRHLFVQGRLPNGPMKQWNGVQTGISASSSLVDALHTCSTRGDCDVLDNDASHAENRRVFTKPGDLTYKQIFHRNNGSGGASGPLFFVKTSTHDVFRANASEYTYSTFYSLIPEMQHRIVDVLKSLHHKVTLEPYAEYIHTELENHYGGGRYKSLKPLVDDVLYRVRHKMKEIRNSVDDRSTFITTTRFDEKIHNMTFTETKHFVGKVGNLAKAVKRYVKRFPAQHHDNTVHRIYLWWAAAVVLVLFFALILYNVYAIEYDTNAASVFRNITMSVCIFVFTLVVSGAFIARYMAKQKYNEQMADNNGKRLLSSAVKTMDVAAQHLEYMAHEQRMTMHPSAVNDAIRAEFVHFYKRIGHVARAEALAHHQQEDASGSSASASSSQHTSDSSNNSGQHFRSHLAREPANLTALYVNIRRVIHTYDHCNTITVPSRPPFPTFEIIMYALVAFIALAMLFYSYAKIDPLGKVRNIHTLNEVRDNLKSGMQHVANPAILARCHRASDEVWSTVMNITVLIMVVLIFMVAYFIIKSSSNYENSLYMSALYSDGKCQP